MQPFFQSGCKLVKSPAKVNRFPFRKNINPSEVLHKLIVLKGAFSGLRQFLATENSLKMMKNAFYFSSKALFVLEIHKFLS